MLAIVPLTVTAAYAAEPVPELIAIPAGAFIAGSDESEREAAYRLDEAAYGHDVTRQQRWYAGERKRSTVETGAYLITRTLITNAQYAAFVDDTGYPAPDVDPETWKGYRLVHPYERTRPFAWVDGTPPKGREDHPVVLVSHDDARAYAEWLRDTTGRNWRLPSEIEWEKAARGVDGRRFPWGDGFDPSRLNSNDGSPFSTVPVGSHPSGASPFGLSSPGGVQDGCRQCPSRSPPRPIHGTWA